MLTPPWRHPKIEKIGTNMGIQMMAVLENQNSIAIRSKDKGLITSKLLYITKI